MIERLIYEIKTCLKNGCYMAALTTALTLPDICGKAKYPDEKFTKKRYVKWLDEYIKQCGNFPDNCSAVPYLSGELIYSLRCSVLHEGSPEIKKEKLDIDYFELIWRETEGAFSAVYSVETVHNDDGSNKCEKFSINLRYLCNVICQATESYYDNNKERFNFFNYNLVDSDHITKKIFNLGERKVQ